MNKSTSLEALLNTFLKDMTDHSFTPASDFPNIDLYMDQVTTFMDENLAHTKRYSDDKILTKTMINNYAKNHMLPAPTKKKYSKDHMLLLIFIYYFKNILSINDIQILLNPMTESYFKNESGHDMSWLYDHLTSVEPSYTRNLTENIRDIHQQAQQLFKDEDDDNQPYLELLSMITLLSFDVYSKKQLIEKLIDQFAKEHTEETKKKK